MIIAAAIFSPFRSTNGQVAFPIASAARNASMTGRSDTGKATNVK
jgi:hypothetical protein